MSMISPDAIKKYVQRRGEDLTACKQALENRDFSVIENVGHKMKGNGLTFGYPELADIGRDMENAATNKDWEVVQSKVTEFENWVEKNKDFSPTADQQPSL